MNATLYSRTVKCGYICDFFCEIRYITGSIIFTGDTQTSFLMDTLHTSLGVKEYIVTEVTTHNNLGAAEQVRQVRWPLDQAK